MNEFLAFAFAILIAAPRLRFRAMQNLKIEGEIASLNKNWSSFAGFCGFRESFAESWFLRAKVLPGASSRSFGNNALHIAWRHQTEGLCIFHKSSAILSRTLFNLPLSLVRHRSIVFAFFLSREMFFQFPRQRQLLSAPACKRRFIL